MRKERWKYMLIIGSHISFSKGYEDMGKQAVELGANTFATVAPFLLEIHEEEVLKRWM